MKKPLFHFTNADAAILILESGELRPSNVLGCNDPFECDNNPFYIRFKNLDEVNKYYNKLFQLYRQGSKFLSSEVSNKILNMTPVQLAATMDRAIKTTKESLIPYGSQFLFEYQENISSFDKLRNLGVIYCFSKCNVSDAILLWGHYARSHTGVAFEFDLSSEKYKGRVHQVEYPADLRRGGICSLNEAIQLLKFADSSTGIQTMFFKKTALNKHRDWAYENEWRMISVKQDSRPSPHIMLTGNILKSIYLGFNMHVDIKKKISSIAKEKYSEINIYEATKDLVYKRLNFTPSKIGLPSH